MNDLLGQNGNDGSVDGLPTILPSGDGGAEVDETGQLGGLHLKHPAHEGERRGFGLQGHGLPLDLPSGAFED
jgi:hypothetical protein